jgi:hypothetical protein
VPILPVALVAALVQIVAEQDRRISELEATLPPKRAKTAATK